MYTLEVAWHCGTSSLIKRNENFKMKKRASKRFMLGCSFLPRKQHMQPLYYAHLKSLWMLSLSLCLWVECDRMFLMRKYSLHRSASVVYQHHHQQQQYWHCQQLLQLYVYKHILNIKQTFATSSLLFLCTLHQVS